jgi:metal-responsive CopG/Arc/MetJ family transcriptional regulator
MKAIQVLFDERLLAALDADETVRKEGRSAVLRRMATEYLHQRRDRQIREQYEQAYRSVADLGPEWEGWEDEAQWPAD